MHGCAPTGESPTASSSSTARATASAPPRTTAISRCSWTGRSSQGGDSGIYLRGSPQVQIWDPDARAPSGSGGLYNNQKNPSKPLKIADKPVGEWNTFRIIMIGERVTVYLNGGSSSTTSSWRTTGSGTSRSTPGQIELQAHGNSALFPEHLHPGDPARRRRPPPWPRARRTRASSPLFNGTGPRPAGRATPRATRPRTAGSSSIPKLGGGNLYTEREYADFVLRFDFKLTPGANNGIGIRAPARQATPPMRAWRSRSSKTGRPSTGRSSPISTTARSTASSRRAEDPRSRSASGTPRRSRREGRRVTVERQRDDDRGRRHRQGQRGRDDGPPRPSRPEARDEAISASSATARSSSSAIFRVKELK